MNLFRLDGETALVTGGVRGLGKGMAMGLAQAGANIVLAARHDNPDTVREIRRFGVRCTYVPVDLSDVDKLDAFADAVFRAESRIDILVNCAGVNLRHPSIDFPKRDWDTVLNVNLNAVFCLCRIFGGPMIERKHGKIINVGSLLSYQGGYTAAAYAASKGALMQLTKAFSNEWAKEGVNVNCLVPGYFDTDLNEALIKDEARSERILERIPQGRWGKPEDLAGAAVFMASAASDYMNGAAVLIDGGWLGR
ncbi:MAG: SDR family oxidoreductase [Clostridiales Family XIII bacterium]|jgi:2-deoxy-D-gluconate 3-dehydrogenase|nr:SDR family oxidoreductase [Clostridiales Family XIII bacterium]